MPLEYFSDRAEECLRLAQHTSSPHDRGFLLEMARAWYGIAQEGPETADPVKRPH